MHFQSFELLTQLLEVLDPGVVGVDEVGDVDLDVGGGRVAVEGVNKVRVVVALPQLHLLVRARETSLAFHILHDYQLLYFNFHPK